MQRSILAGVLILMLAGPALGAEVDETGRTESGGLARSGTMFVRGVVGIVTLPCDLYRTTHREIQMHRWIWPVTVLPRQFTNIVGRASSSAHDFFIAPWAVAPFTDDISPLSEGMGLPDYPCQAQ